MIQDPATGIRYSPSFLISVSRGTGTWVLEFSPIVGAREMLDRSTAHADYEGWFDLGQVLGQEYGFIAIPDPQKVRPEAREIWINPRHILSMGPNQIGGMVIVMSNGHEYRFAPELGRQMERAIVGLIEHAPTMA